MSIWRRTITIILMVVFLPATVLAGTPLRLCVGDDGHRAIEFVLAADHHAAADDGHDCENADELHFSPTAECSDSPLLETQAQTSNYSAQLKPLPMHEDSPILALQAMESAAHVSRDAPRHASKRCHLGRLQPQLDTLRTVILQI